MDLQNEGPVSVPEPEPTGFSFESGGVRYQVGTNIVTTWTNRQVRELKKRRLMSRLAWIRSEKKGNPSDSVNQIEEETIRELVDSDSRGFVDCLEMIDDEEAVEIFLVSACDQIESVEQAKEVLEKADLIEVVKGLLIVAMEVQKSAENLRRQLVAQEENPSD